MSAWPSPKQSQSFRSRRTGRPELSSLGLTLGGSDGFGLNARPPRPRNAPAGFPYWLASLSPDTLIPISPNRRDLEPNRRAQEGARARRTDPRRLLGAHHCGHRGGWGEAGCARLRGPVKRRHRLTSQLSPAKLIRSAPPALAVVELHLIGHPLGALF